MKKSEDPADTLLEISHHRYQRCLLLPNFEFLGARNRPELATVSFKVDIPQGVTGRKQYEK